MLGKTSFLEEWKKEPHNRWRSLKRLKSLHLLFEEVRQALDWEGVTLDRRLLANAVYSYFIDIDRHKEFHRIAWANEYKRAAYTAIWLVRIRPVQVHHDLSNEDCADYHLYANEFFAITAALHFLDVTPGKVPKDFFSLLIYEFRYRPTSPAKIISLFYAIDWAVKGEEPPITLPNEFLSS
ncbi:MAG: hypothetical protein HQL53_06090 [Magnetococcales bacterium]|nr:hypothetical protein [Magnetococcales bacterium]